LRPEGSRSALSAVLRPCACLQSCSRWVLPSLTREIGSGVNARLRRYRDMEWSMPIDGNSLSISHPCMVRRIASVHRSANRNRASFAASQLRIVFWGSLLLSRCIEASRCSFRDLSSIRVIALRIVGGLWPYAMRGIRWQCDSGYSAIAVFGGWCDSVGSMRRLWGGDFGDANTSFECDRGATVVRSKQVVVDRVGFVSR
jgi:hypothetical protein